MSGGSAKAKLEANLLKIWYGAGKPSPLVFMGLSALEATYKMLRLLSRQAGKTRTSKMKTSPPLLVVGNLIAGGAGKTPLVMAVCQTMTATGRKVGIISRGYGRKHSHAVLINPDLPLPTADDVGDEPLFLCTQTRCPVAVGADRNAALDLLLQHFPELDLIVSDDGLQHHRLKRQLEWVVFDSRGQGNGRLLPAGPLREPLDRLQTVDAVIASNLSTSTLSKLLHAPKDHRWHEVTVGLSGFRHLQTGGFLDTEQAKNTWSGQTIAAFTGIANPEKLFSALKNMGVTSVHEQGLPDHFDYPDDFCAQFSQSVLITTGKDAVKLNSSNRKVWVAEIRVELPPILKQALEDCIGSTIN